MSVHLALGWAALLPTTALLALVLYLPGVGALLILRTRISVALAGGPLMTAALLGVGGVALHTVGMRYNAVAYLLLMVLLWAVALLIRRLLNRGGLWRGARKDQGALRGLRRLTAARALMLLGAGALGLASMWVPTALMIDPAMPNPRVDPMYHYNVLNAIGETGSASMFAAVDFNYGVQVRHVIYPTVWHAITSLAVPLVGIVPAANVVSYLVTPIVFVVNSALLARVLFRRQVLAAAVGAIAAGVLPAFPGGLAFTKSFWPNELAVAMLPGLLVVLIMFLRRCRWGHIRRRPLMYLLDLAITLGAVAGLGLTHPSVFFSFLVIAVPLLASTLMRARRVARRTMSPRAHAAFVGSLVAAVVVGTGLLLIPEQVRSFLMRENIAHWDDFVLKGVSMISNWPTDVSNPAGVLTALVYIPLVLTGIFRLARHREHRWVAWAWALQLFIIVGSYFPIPVLSAFAGLWYSDTFRLYAIQASILPLAVVAVVLWAQGRVPAGTTWMDRVPKRLRQVWVWGAIGAALLGTGYITTGTARQVGVDSSDARPVMSAEEAELIGRIGDQLPEGSVVVGDPASGVAYLPLASGVESVFTQMNVRDVDEDGIFLFENFDDIHQDPRVCDVLEHYGIGYYYEDAAFDYNYSEREEAMPGFYEVDTAHGFTLIDEGGGARLWRIDTCGPIEAPDDGWWDREKRLHPYIQEPESEPLTDGSSSTG